jgi:type IV pilus assembly protein PilZ
MNEPKGRDRRVNPRYDTHIQVDYSHGETFLFSYIENISEMGIFIYSESPLPIGTELSMRFGPEGRDPMELKGTVVWVNPVKNGNNINPGMGVRFDDITPEAREWLVDIIHTMAYLGETPAERLN